ncbi:competence protein ComZ [Salibacterium salarium]|uniref:Competence protein ComG n=1 Tax=Salibacterium salarium TaxID=284579 RepID=A0A3R9QQL1_9BACI|nr:ComZ family protein [Salibacterium salarium]MDQ0298811.1 competence protein ComZ [Salibacterium salarium]RSL31022.1 competence protein ComG [Salibacterium salarium]RSL31212.1 competence protein ComG [Salibacterium salarium]
MDQERNMKFMQIAMKHIQEGRAFLDEKGIELDMHDLQPALDMLMQVMNEAYEMGYEEGKNE